MKIAPTPVAACTYEILDRVVGLLMTTQVVFARENFVTDVADGPAGRSDR